MGYLLDTDTCSAHLKENASVTKFVLQYSGQIHLSVLNAGELLTWVLREGTSPKRRAGVFDFLSGVPLLPVTEEIAEEFGRLQAALLDAGRPTPVTDLWIAATAVSHDLVLVTHNARHFAHVPGLAIEDWLTR